MQEELMKSLVALIDESLAEIEELKKSDRFSASEIKLEGPGTGIAGKDPNGKLDKEEDKDDEDEKDEDEKEVEKAEGKNSEADPNGGKHEVVKAEGKNSEADPNAGKHEVVKAEDKKEDDKEDEEDEEDKMKEMKKSIDESNSLMKSYVDQRLAPIESKMETLIALVKQVADTPVPSKSVSYKNIAPLKKSDDEGSSTLTKSMLADRLLDLKKSGHKVDSADIVSVELAQGNDLAKIANKYGIK